MSSPVLGKDAVLLTEENDLDDGSVDSEQHYEDRYCFPTAHHSEHELPKWVYILRIVLTGLSMACVSLLMLFCETFLISKKFRFAQHIIESHEPALGVFLATLFVVGAGTLMVAVAAIFVTNIFPLGAGSGIGELKGFINGCTISGLYNISTTWVGPVGAVLSTGAGLPIDREGPLISIGAGVGVGITRLLGRKYFTKWVQFDVTGGDQEQFFLDEHKYSELKRQGAILGGAAGLAVAYNAPLGGLVYMLEEVTLVLWPERSMAAAGLAVGIAAFSAKGILLLFGESAHELVIFSYGTTVHDVSWGWMDMPGFLLVATIAACLSAIYSGGLLSVWRYRHGGSFVSKVTRKHRKTARVVEATIFTMICVSILMISPAVISSCKEMPPAGLEMHRTFIRYTCPNGEFNELATLFLQGEEGAAKMLIARDTVRSSSNSLNSSSSSSVADEGSHGRLLGGAPPVDVEGDVLQFEPWVLLCALVIYLPLSIGTAGLSLPMGYFVPNMMIGGLIGNALRTLLGGIGELNGFLAHPGIYGLIGSASMISGFTGMTIGIVVLLCEAGNDIKMAPPLLIVTIYSQILAHFLVKHPYEEQLIIDKQVPYLEPECPPHIEKEGWTAGSVCAHVPPEALLQRHVKTSDVKRVLESPACAHLEHLPIVDDRGWRCIGLVPRGRLAQFLQADDSKQDEPEKDYHIGKQWSSQSSKVRNTLMSLKADGEDISTAYAMSEEDMDLSLSDFVRQTSSGDLDLQQLADPAPIDVLEDVPLARIYELFAKANVTAVCVLASKPVAYTSILPSMSRRVLKLHTQAADQLGLRGILERRHVATLQHRHARDEEEDEEEDDDEGLSVTGRVLSRSSAGS